MAGWHTCFICKGRSYFRCLCCPGNSVCRGCLRQAKFVKVGKQTKGFCNNCIRMAIMIEKNIEVDSDGVSKSISLWAFNLPCCQVQIPWNAPLTMFQKIDPGPFFFYMDQITQATFFLRLNYIPFFSSFRSEIAKISDPSWIPQYLAVNSMVVLTCCR